jgi:hypothetical protein
MERPILHMSAAALVICASLNFSKVDPPSVAMAGPQPVCVAVERAAYERPYRLSGGAADPGDTRRMVEFSPQSWFGQGLPEARDVQAEAVVGTGALRRR